MELVEGKTPSRLCGETFGIAGIVLRYRHAISALSLARTTKASFIVT